MHRRLFIGIGLESNFIHDLESLRTDLPELPDTRWIPGGSLHVTIEFLGSVEEEKFETLKKQLQTASQRISAFELIFEKFCVKAQNNHEGMIWCQFQMSPVWASFVDAIGKSTSFLREAHWYRAPVPHITLGRIKDLKKIPRLSFPQLPPTSIPVRSFHLYESRLSQEGSVYEILSTFPMKGSTL